MLAVMATELELRRRPQTGELRDSEDPGEPAVEESSRRRFSSDAHRSEADAAVARTRSVGGSSLRVYAIGRQPSASWGSDAPLDDEPWTPSPKPHSRAPGTLPSPAGGSTQDRPDRAELDAAPLVAQGADEAPQRGASGAGAKQTAPEVQLEEEKAERGNTRDLRDPQGSSKGRLSAKMGELEDAKRRAARAAAGVSERPSSKGSDVTRRVPAPPPAFGFQDLAARFFPRKHSGAPGRHRTEAPRDKTPQRPSSHGVFRSGVPLAHHGRLPSLSDPSLKCTPEEDTEGFPARDMGRRSAVPTTLRDHQGRSALLGAAESTAPEVNGVQAANGVAQEAHKVAPPEVPALARPAERTKSAPRRPPGAGTPGASKVIHSGPIQGTAAAGVPPSTLSAPLEGYFSEPIDPAWYAGRVPGHRASLEAVSMADDESVVLHMDCPLSAYPSELDGLGLGGERRGASATAEMTREFPEPVLVLGRVSTRIAAANSAALQALGFASEEEARTRTLMELAEDMPRRDWDAAVSRLLGREVGQLTLKLRLLKSERPSALNGQWVDLTLHLAGHGASLELVGMISQCAAPLEVPSQPGSRFLHHPMQPRNAARDHSSGPPHGVGPTGRSPHHSAPIFPSQKLIQKQVHQQQHEQQGQQQRQQQDGEQQQAQEQWERGGRSLGPGPEAGAGAAHPGLAKRNLLITIPGQAEEDSEAADTPTPSSSTPGVTTLDSSRSQDTPASARSTRAVYDCGPLSAGARAVAHSGPITGGKQAAHHWVASSAALPLRSVSMHRGSVEVLRPANEIRRAVTPGWQRSQARVLRSPRMNAAFHAHTSPAGRSMALGGVGVGYAGGTSAEGGRDVFEEEGEEEEDEDEDSFMVPRTRTWAGVDRKGRRAEADLRRSAVARGAPAAAAAAAAGAAVGGKAAGGKAEDPSASQMLHHRPGQQQGSSSGPAVASPRRSAAKEQSPREQGLELESAGAPEGRGPRPQGDQRHTGGAPAQGSAQWERKKGSSPDDGKRPTDGSPKDEPSPPVGRVYTWSADEGRRRTGGGRVSAAARLSALLRRPSEIKVRFVRKSSLEKEERQKAAALASAAGGDRQRQAKGGAQASRQGSSKVSPTAGASRSPSARRPATGGKVGGRQRDSQTARKAWGTPRARHTSGNAGGILGDRYTLGKRTLSAPQERAGTMAKDGGRAPRRPAAAETAPPSAAAEGGAGEMVVGMRPAGAAQGAHHVFPGAGRSSAPANGGVKAASMALTAVPEEAVQVRAKAKLEQQLPHGQRPVQLPHHLHHHHLAPQLQPQPPPHPPHQPPPHPVPQPQHESPPEPHPQTQPRRQPPHQPQHELIPQSQDPPQQQPYPKTQPQPQHLFQAEPQAQPPTGWTPLQGTGTVPLVQLVPGQSGPGVHMAARQLASPGQPGTFPLRQKHQQQQQQQQQEQELHHQRQWHQQAPFVPPLEQTPQEYPQHPNQLQSGHPPPHPGPHQAALVQQMQVQPLVEAHPGQRLLPGAEPMAVAPAPAVAVTVATAGQQPQPSLSRQPSRSRPQDQERSSPTPRPQAHVQLAYPVPEHGVVLGSSGPPAAPGVHQDSRTPHGVQAGNMWTEGPAGSAARGGPPLAPRDGLPSSGGGHPIPIPMGISLVQGGHLGPLDAPPPGPPQQRAAGRGLAPGARSGRNSEEDIPVALPLSSTNGARGSRAPPLHPGLTVDLTLLARREEEGEGDVAEDEEEGEGGVGGYGVGVQTPGRRMGSMRATSPTMESSAGIIQAGPAARERRVRFSEKVRTRTFVRQKSKTGTAAPKAADHREASSKGPGGAASKEGSGKGAEGAGTKDLLGKAAAAAAATSAQRVPVGRPGEGDSKGAKGPPIASPSPRDSASVMLAPAKWASSEPGEAQPEAHSLGAHRSSAPREAPNLHRGSSLSSLKERDGKEKEAARSGVAAGSGAPHAPTGAPATWASASHERQAQHGARSRPSQGPSQGRLEHHISESEALELASRGAAAAQQQPQPQPQAHRDAAPSGRAQDGMRALQKARTFSERLSSKGQGDATRGDLGRLWAQEAAARVRRGEASGKAPMLEAEAQLQRVMSMLLHDKSPKATPEKHPGRAEDTPRQGAAAPAGHKGGPLPRQNSTRAVGQALGTPGAALFVPEGSAYQSTPAVTPRGIRPGLKPAGGVPGEDLRSSSGGRRGSAGGLESEKSTPSPQAQQQGHQAQQQGHHGMGMPGASRNTQRLAKNRQLQRVMSALEADPMAGGGSRRVAKGAKAQGPMDVAGLQGARDAAGHTGEPAHTAAVGGALRVLATMSQNERNGTGVQFISSPRVTPPLTPSDRLGSPLIHSGGCVSPRVLARSGSKLGMPQAQPGFADARPTSMKEWPLPEQVLTPVASSAASVFDVPRSSSLAIHGSQILEASWPSPSWQHPGEAFSQYSAPFNGVPEAFSVIPNSLRSPGGMAGYSSSTPNGFPHSAMAWSMSEGHSRPLLRDAL